MTEVITVPRGKNVGKAILNAIAGTKKYVKSVELKRDIKNKCIYATILLTWLK